MPSRHYSSQRVVQAHEKECGEHLINRIFHPDSGDHTEKHQGAQTQGRENEKRCPEESNDGSNRTEDLQNSSQESEFRDSEPLELVAHV